MLNKYMNYMAYIMFWRNFKEMENGTSLVVQWLRLQAPSEGGKGSVPGQGTRSHVPQLRPSAAKS